jgi:hypothetical protein
MYSRESIDSFRQKYYANSALPGAAKLARVGFYFFTLASFSVCLLMILYHSRVLSWSNLLETALIEKEKVEDEEVELHSGIKKKTNFKDTRLMSSGLYGLGFAMDFMLVAFYTIQQRVNNPCSSPRKYFSLYLGITLLFVAYFLAILFMFSMRVFGFIDGPVDEDFLLNFALFGTHVLCMTISAGMKMMEVGLIEWDLKLFILVPHH